MSKHTPGPHEPPRTYGGHRPVGRLRCWLDRNLFSDGQGACTMNIQKLATNEMDGSELLYDHEYRRFIVAWDDENGDQIETVFGCRETAIAAFFDGRLPGERQ